MTLQDTIQALPDAEFRDLKAWIVTTETDRRAAQPAVEQAQAQLVEELWEAKPELRPDAGTVDITPATTTAELIAQVQPWEQPATPIDGYPRQVLTARNNRVWRNRRPGNMKTPGDPFSGWEDVTDDYLRLADALDGNHPDVGTDAPGLVTKPQPEPEPETTPAPQVQEWYIGAKIEQGIPWLHNGQLYIAKTTHTATAANAPGKSTRHWTPLPA
ncbi:hypothetical protein ACUXOC_000281 [Corynebacterium mucifaciens]